MLLAWHFLAEYVYTTCGICELATMQLQSLSLTIRVHQNLGSLACPLASFETGPPNHLVVEPKHPLKQLLECPALPPKYPDALVQGPSSKIWITPQCFMIVT